MNSHSYETPRMYYGRIITSFMFAYVRKYVLVYMYFIFGVLMVVDTAEGSSIQLEGDLEASWASLEGSWRLPESSWGLFFKKIHCHDKPTSKHVKPTIKKMRTSYAKLGFLLKVKKVGKTSSEK